MDVWTKASRYGAVPTCVLCNRNIYKHDMDRCGYTERKGAKPVIWHDECYQRTFGKTAEEYERMGKAFLQTELSGSEQEQMANLKKGKKMAKTESIRVYKNSNDKVMMAYVDAYPERNGLYVHKTSDKKPVWNVVDGESGLWVVRSFKTKKEAEAAITAELIEKVEQARKRASYRATVKVAQLTWERGGIASDEWNKLIKEYEAKELEEVKAANEKPAKPKVKPQPPKRKKATAAKPKATKAKPKAEPKAAKPKATKAKAEPKAIVVTLKGLEKWAKAYEGVSVRQYGEGNSLWVYGVTKAHKGAQDELKKAGFAWAPKAKHGAGWWAKPTA